jgi:TolB-like protein
MPFANLSGDPEQEYFADGIESGRSSQLGTTLRTVQAGNRFL